MKTYELSISRNYVSNWTKKEAIREILQNAIDQGDMSVSYKDSVITISSSGHLDASTLVLGNTSKFDDKTQIGKYGEGYKLAMLVLLREGHSVTVTNGEEVWTPYFSMSDSFNMEVLKVDIEDGDFDDGVSFIVTGVNQSDYSELKRLFPCIEEDYGESVDSGYGQILMDSRFSGKIFVGGLYVQSDSAFKYGYNFKTEVVDLDRDRKAINYWTLRKLTACSLITADNCNARIFKAISNSCTDAKEIIEVLDEASKEFVKEYRDMYYTENGLTENSLVVTKGIERELKSTGEAVRNRGNMEDAVIHVGNEIDAFIVAKANDNLDWMQRAIESSKQRAKSEDALHNFRNSSFRKLLKWHEEIRESLTNEENDEFNQLFFEESDFQPDYFNKIIDIVRDNLDDYLDNKFVDEILKEVKL